MNFTYIPLGLVKSKLHLVGRWSKVEQIFNSELLFFRVLRAVGSLCILYGSYSLWIEVLVAFSYEPFFKFGILAEFLVWS